MKTVETALSKDLNSKVAHLPKRFYLGNNRSVAGGMVFMSLPSFDCNWYWSFGYLGNRDCHYHLEGIEKDKNLHMFDKVKAHFGSSLTITDDKDLWLFCEISLTIYTLKKTAELFYMGGSHTTTNPDKDLLKNDEYYNHIVSVLIPAQILSLYKMLAKYPAAFRN